MRDDAIAGPQPGNLFSHFGDYPGGFVAENVGQLGDIPVTGKNMEVGTANAAGTGFDEDLVRRDLGYGHVFEREGSAHVAHDGGFHPVESSPRRYRRLYTPPKGPVKGLRKNHS
jgi:hypothetical protein